MHDYQKQARDALATAKGALTITRATKQKLPPWDDPKDPRPHAHYLCTLEGPGGRYTFDFFQSIAATAKGEVPSEYDVLTCLEWHTPESFDEFCSEFGYSTDSRKAFATHKACLAQTEALLRIFPRETARNALQEVR